MKFEGERKRASSGNCYLSNIWMIKLVPDSNLLCKCCSECSNFLF